MYRANSIFQKGRTSRQPFFIVFCTLLGCLVGATLASAKDYSFAWSANPEPVEGYKLYYKKGGDAAPPFDGTASPQGSSPIDLGNRTSFTITGLEDNTTYHFALTAYNGDDESGMTEIISVFGPATDPAPPAIDPLNAVITTDSQAGEAPFTVTFDASASSGLISSYLWTFGDSETAAGAIASHTYQTAGTYTAILTVLDTDGWSQQAAVEIQVDEPLTSSSVPDTPPAGDVSSTSGTGNEPVTEPSDGGGVIPEQLPGTTVPSDATDNSSAEGDDGSGETAAATPDDNGTPITPAKSMTIEVGEVTVNQEWVTVLFENTFSEPVVIAAPPITMNEQEPVLARIRNVDQQGFEVRLQEWDYQDDRHAPEILHYMVIEEGIHTLDDGTKIEAGKFNGSRRFKDVILQQAYDLTPVILTQVLTVNETDAVTGRIRKSTQGSFQYKLQEQEANQRLHLRETVGYIAWEPGKGEFSGLLYEAGFASSSVTHRWYDLSFQTEFSDLPFFIAGMQDCAGGNTAAVRSQKLRQTAIQVKIEEEQSRDDEVRHIGESVGYLVIGSAIKVKE
ncbi:MAG: PKD domain-containing protein [Desulforhopalus sp.]